MLKTIRALFFAGIFTILSASAALASASNAATAPVSNTETVQARLNESRLETAQAQSKGLRLGTAAAVPGDSAPDFKLSDTDGRERSLAEFAGKYVVLEWTNPDCPFVKAHYDAGAMQQVQETYTAKGVVWLAVASSGPGLQGYYEAAAWKKINANHKTQATAVLLDPQGRVGKLYGVKATPHMVVINSQGAVIYAGAIDSALRPYAEDIAESKNYVAQALDEALSGHKVSIPSTKTHGCPVKYAF